VLVDTDVLIWHLRGYSSATITLDNIDSLTISAATYLEILQGVNSKAELVAIKKMLERRDALILPITENISQKAIDLLESFALSHGLQMGDALIAATALEHNLTLLTGNVKHFKPIPLLRVEKFEI
jgi:predicted nucleic acid-binding protein